MSTGSTDERQTDGAEDDEVGEDDAPGPCSLVAPFEQIGSQWRLIVLNDLLEGEKRFNQLKRSTSASSRTLSRVLDDLQDLGFVERRVEAEGPVATFYSLTEKGESLAPVFEAIECWAEEWLTDDED